MALSQQVTDIKMAYIRRTIAKILRFACGYVCKLHALVKYSIFLYFLYLYHFKRVLN